MEFYIGMIIPFAGDFAPEGWLPCDGRSLNVSEYQALYSIIGNKYGGQHPQFNLPNLKGRVPVGNGDLTEQGLTKKFSIGENGGQMHTTLLANNLPPHVHPASFTGVTSGSHFEDVSVQDGTIEVTVPMPNNATDVADTNISSTPANGMSLGVGNSSGRAVNIYSSKEPNVRLGIESVKAKGTFSGKLKGTVVLSSQGAVNVKANITNSVPLYNMQPYQVINYIICVNGLYPVKP